MSIIKSNEADLKITARFLKRRGYSIPVGARYVEYNFIRENQGSWLTLEGSEAFFSHNPIEEDNELHLYAWIGGRQKDINDIKDLIEVENYFRKR